MKNKNLAQTLEDLKKINLSGKIAYAIAKNRKLIETELEVLNETVKILPDFEAYEKERITLLESHASKDESGKAIIETTIGQDGKPSSSYKIENQEDWEKAIKELQEDHKEAIETRTKQINDFNALMEEESNIDFYPFTEDQIPDNATASEIYTLLELIDKK